MLRISDRLNTFLKNNEIILTLIDVGARGEVQSIWKPLMSNLKIIGFEPDEEEFKNLVFKNPKNKYFNIALSDKNEAQKLFITNDPSCSSLYKPNFDYIKIFEPINWVSKKIVSTVDLKCERLDLLYSDEVDYIKIDTQGSELKILMGAEEILVNQHPIVSCETWCSEIYENAPNFNQIINYMDSLGYEIFDMETAAAWKFNCKVKVVSRKRKIGFEVLFVKSHMNLSINNRESLKKHILILEYLGYRDYAIFLDSLFQLNLNSYLLKNNKIFSEFFKGKLNTILYYLNKLNLFPTYR